MSTLPTMTDVLAHLAALSEEGYTEEARRRASTWATPLLIAADTPLTVEPSSLGRALYLLGAADLLAGFDTFLYGPIDFEEATRELRAESVE